MLQGAGRQNQALSLVCMENHRAWRGLPSIAHLIPRPSLGLVSGLCSGHLLCLSETRGCDYLPCLQASQATLRLTTALPPQGLGDPQAASRRDSEDSCWVIQSHILDFRWSPSFTPISPPQALMSLFVLASKDGWVDIMYDGLDAVGVDQQVGLGVVGLTLGLRALPT